MRSEEKKETDLYIIIKIVVIVVSGENVSRKKNSKLILHLPLKHRFMLYVRTCISSIYLLVSGFIYYANKQNCLWDKVSHYFQVN